MTKKDFKMSAILQAITPLAITDLSPANRRVKNKVIAFNFQSSMVGNIGKTIALLVSDLICFLDFQNPFIEMIDTKRTFMLNVLLK